MSIRDLITHTPQPEKNGKGGTDPGPRNVERDRQNPDMLTPPETDHGTIPNLRFSFSDSHNRLEKGGWAREVTIRELPVAKAMAGVNMRLNPGAVREMHWHKEAEWAYMIDGRARVTSVDQNGQNFADDLGVGDLWYFPSGIPHSIQALAEGCEFLLVFDDGEFSENSTFLITDWFAHTPKEVLAANFGVPESEFANIPKKELYIFEDKVPGPLETSGGAFAAGAGAGGLYAQADGAAADPDLGGNGAGGGCAKFCGVEDDCGGAGGGGAGRAARDALAPELG